MLTAISTKGDTVSINADGKRDADGRCWQLSAPKVTLSASKVMPSASVLMVNKMLTVNEMLTGDADGKRDADRRCWQPSAPKVTLSASKVMPSALMLTAGKMLMGDADGRCWWLSALKVMSGKMLMLGEMLIVMATPSGGNFSGLHRAWEAPDSGDWGVSVLHMGIPYAAQATQTT